MSIIRAIPRTETQEWIDRFFDEHTERSFPLRGFPRDLNEGAWLYLNYQGRIIGRCRILRLERVNRDIPVGSQTQRHPIQSNCRVIVQCPAEPAPREIPMRGRQGFQYTNDLW
jgi:hypothetical protein